MTSAPMPRLSDAHRAVHAAVGAEPQDEDGAEFERPASVLAASAQATPAVRDMSEGDLGRLRGVLAELTECRRLIDATVGRSD